MGIHRSSIIKGFDLSGYKLIRILVRGSLKLNDAVSRCSNKSFVYDLY